MDIFFKNFILVTNFFPVTNAPTNCPTCVSTLVSYFFDYEALTFFPDLYSTIALAFLDECLIGASIKRTYTTFRVCQRMKTKIFLLVTMAQIKGSFETSKVSFVSHVTHAKKERNFISIPACLPRFDCYRHL